MLPEVSVSPPGSHAAGPGRKGQLAKALFGRTEQYRLARYRLVVELRQLEAFVAVATELHFGRVAEGEAGTVRLGITPPVARCSRRSSLPWRLPTTIR